MRPRAALVLASLALAAAPSRASDAPADDAVIVIRGSNVSVARPLTAERARDGSAEVEIVRVEATPPPPPPAPRTAEPERELVVVLLPVPEAPPPVGVPIAWTPWPWSGRPDFHPLPPWPGRVHGRREAHFPPAFHPLGIHRGPVRRIVRGR